jgi:hypothetical protein
LLDLLLEEIRRNTPRANLAPNLNRFIVKDYFDELKELLMRLDIMDKPEGIYIADEKGMQF